MDEYLEMLRVLRYGDGPEVVQWRRDFLEDLGGSYDGYGNYIVEVEGGGGVLFSCHYDTVGWGLGRRQLEVVDGFVFNFGTEPLGADDTNGVWVLRQLIRRGFPGTYIFHADEERGGLGSCWVAEHRRDWLAQFHTAIAIDRRGYRDVITHMRGERVCSDAVAEYLAQLLDMEPCPHGGLTDTYHYRHVIPNCTNISCGYFREHTPEENSDFYFCQTLVERLLRFDLRYLAEKASKSQSGQTVRSYV